VEPKSVAELKERNHLDINANALTLRKMCANETALALQIHVSPIHVELEPSV
jgi:hypothetical protein